MPGVRVTARARRSDICNEARALLAQVWRAGRQRRCGAVDSPAHHSKWRGGQRQWRRKRPRARRKRAARSG